MTAGCKIVEETSVFQLTSSRRGWRLRRRYRITGWYFNSHPHEEDDNFNNLLRSGIDISTHILTKRMTEDLERDGAVDDISTHILTKRMTRICPVFILWQIFQLTSSRRGWQKPVDNSEQMEEFQLTSSRRGWRRPGRWQGKNWNFNSHPHEEDDFTETGKRYRYLISTHILTKRMTAISLDSKHNCSIFQLTSSRRGWRLHQCNRRKRREFQLTSSRRGWQRISHSLHPTSPFQLTSSRRGWRQQLSGYT